MYKDVIGLPFRIFWVCLLVFGRNSHSNKQKDWCNSTGKSSSHLGQYYFNCRLFYNPHFFAFVNYYHSVWAFLVIVTKFWENSTLLSSGKGKFVVKLASSQGYASLDKQHMQWTVISECFNYLLCRIPPVY